MQVFKGQVQNGHIVIDEATELCDGEMIWLVPLEELLTGDSDVLDDASRTCPIDGQATGDADRDTARASRRTRTGGGHAR
jgi:hypothetical protein